MKRLAVLYGVEPVGEGTALVESLTSFVSRLAVARHLRLRSVFDKLIYPRVPKYMVEGEKGKSYWCYGFRGMNGVVWDGHSEFAEILASILSELTALENLSCHTWVPWRQLLVGKSNGVLSWGKKRWCASCLAQWREEGVEAWEPLIWRVSFVKRCPVHGTPLSEVCGACKRRQGFLSDIVPVGLCCKCRTFLEKGDDLVREGFAFPSTYEEEWEFRLSRAVGRMLACQKEGFEMAGHQGFLRLLDILLRHRDIGSPFKLARYLSTTPESIKNWTQGGHPPNLKSFLKVCLRVEVDPVWVASHPNSMHFGVGEELPDGVRPTGEYRSKKYAPSREWDVDRWEWVRKQLGEWLRNDRCRLYSATKIAEFLGVSSHALKTHCPEEYAALKGLHAEYLREKRSAAFDEIESALREAFEDCISEGMRPTVRRALEYAGLSPKLMIGERYRRLWKQIKEENGYVD